MFSECDIFILVLILKYVVCNESDINVGTVLFTQSDNSRRCWSNEQLALLRARFVFEDVLPKPSSITMDDDKFVTALVGYFHMSIDKVKSMTNGKTKQINLMALTDAIGGYMKHIVLPVGKHAFYTGKINFNSVENLKVLYDDLKTFLHTDGKSWRPPSSHHHHHKRSAENLDQIPNEYETKPCDNLVFTTSENGDITIPTPFLDSKTNPTSIALPFKTQQLRNIKSPTNSFILVKYYKTGIACLKEKNANQQSTDKFVQNLDHFIDDQVMGQLDNEDIYPAFGSIFVLKNTLMKKTSNGPSAVQAENENIAKGALSTATGGDHTNSSSVKPTELFDENDEDSDEDQSTMVMIIAAGVVVLIWIITGIIYYCYKRRRDDVPRKTTSKSPPTQTSTTNIDRKPGTPAKKTPSSLTHKIGPKTPTSPTKKTPSDKKPAEQKRKRECDCNDKTPSPPQKTVSSPKSSTLLRAQAQPNKSTSDCRPKGNVQCVKCKRTKCNRHVAFQINTVQSAPLSIQKQEVITDSNTSTDPIVFGYDFETSTTDSSSLDESTSSSSETNLLQNI